MKKFLKSLSVICLMLVMLCPLALVGCDKHYTIDVKVVAGEGYVYRKDMEGINATGKIAVDAGDKFEFVIVPRLGYRIDKVVIDGKTQTDYDNTRAYFDFDNIKGDHKVQVTFIKTSNVVTFWCLSEEAGKEGSFIEFKQVEVNDGASINLNEAKYGGEIALWYKLDSSGNKVYLYNNSSDINASKDSIDANSGIVSNKLYVRNQDKSIYCDKTKSQLALLGVTQED